jgi:hypothetical protein
MTVDFYQDEEGRWRWQARMRNGSVAARGGYGHTNAHGLLAAARRMQAAASTGGARTVLGRAFERAIAKHEGLKK